MWISWREENQLKYRMLGKCHGSCMLKKMRIMKGFKATPFRQKDDINCNGGRIWLSVVLLFFILNWSEML